MDFQENALEEEARKDDDKQVEAVANAVPIQEEQSTDIPSEEPENGSEDKSAAVSKAYKTKQEVIERLKEIVRNDENPKKDELDLLKTTFYKLHIAERDAKQKEYLDAGGDPDKYQIMPDEDEEVFKAEMGLIKEKRAKLFLQQEEEKKENLKKKLEIIEKIKSIATSPDEANKSFQEFKALQQEWKEIKNVPADKANELWRNYQLYVEQFYDLLKLNSEAREYDFKKNFEMKTKQPKNLPMRAISLVPSTNYRSSTSNIVRLDRWQKTFASRYGHALKPLLPLSTRGISSILSNYAHRKKKIFLRRLHFASK